MKTIAGIELCAVFCSDDALRNRAVALGKDTGLEVLHSIDDAEPHRWLLQVSAKGLAIQHSAPGAAGPVRVDFVGGKLGFRRQRQEATPDLVKAVGLRSGIRPAVWDLTAGLGQDAFVLARYGSQVTLFERNPLVFALLADGFDRAHAAASDEEGLAAILQRMQLLAGDSRDYLTACSDAELPHVLYLDTMFPERSSFATAKKTAKVKKGMQLFQSIVGEDGDGEQLLALALARQPHRVVVKRPRHAPPLGGRDSSLTFTGKSIRFDVYPFRKMQSAD